MSDLDEVRYQLALAIPHLREPPVVEHSLRNFVQRAGHAPPATNDGDRRDEDEGGLEGADAAEVDEMLNADFSHIISDISGIKSAGRVDRL